ncbi:MAG: hypothetical protein IPG45_08495 [Deltaproteobacteria bacterium]|nr:hypothetical protein [Deltaproteobacteria bacterium]
MRARWLLLLIGLGACRPTPVRVPIPAETGTVVVIGWDGLLPKGIVAEAQSPPAVDLGRETPGLVLSYTLPPAALGLPLGELSLDPNGRNLPTPEQAWALVDGDVRAAAAEELARLRTHRFRFTSAVCGDCGQVVAGLVQCLPCPNFDPPIPPTPPDRPALPRASACAEGWAMEGGPGGEVFCRPPAAVVCPTTEVPVGGACAPLASCPVGNFPAVPPGAVYVDPAASPGGDGQEARPLRTIAEALAIAPPGGTVALSAGRHEGPVRLDGDRVLVGLCPSQSVITQAVTVEQGEVQLEGLSLEAGLFAEAGTQVSGRRLVFRSIGISVRGRAVLSELSFEATTGPGIRVEAGGELEADRVFVVDAALALSAAAAEVQVRRLRVEGGGGVWLESTRLTLEESWVRGTVGPGLEARQGAHVTGMDLAFLENGGAGLEVAQTSLGLQRLLVADSTGSGIGLAGGSSVLLDVVVERPGGRGLDLVTGTASISRVLVTNPGDFVNFDSSRPVTVQDLTVRSAGGALEGAVFYGSGPYRVQRVEIAGAHKIGVVVAAAGAFTDLTIRGIVRAMANEEAKGVAIRDALATITRVSIADVDGVGLAVGALGDPPPRGQTILEDIAVTDCQEGLSLHGVPPILVHRTSITNTPYEGLQVGNGVAAQLVTVSDLKIEGAGLKTDVNAALLLDRVQATVLRAEIEGSGRGLLLRPQALLTSRMVKVEGNQVGVTLSTGGQTELPGLILTNNEMPLTIE